MVVHADDDDAPTTDMRIASMFVAGVIPVAVPAYAQTLPPLRDATAPSAQEAAPRRMKDPGHENFVLVTPNRKLLWGSGILLGTTYATSVVVAIASSEKADNYLYIPLAGPWLDLALRKCTEPAGVQCQNSTFHGVGLFFDGLLQLVGAVGIYLAFRLPETKWVSAAQPAVFGNGGRGVLLTFYGPDREDKR